MTQPLTPDTLLQFTRLGAIALSPDGIQAVCTAGTVSLDENRVRTALWMLPADGGEPWPLTTCGPKDGAPAFSPDGATVAFTAEREQQGHKDASPQLYLIAAHGGEARRISRHASGIGAFRWMPDGRRLLFVAWAWPELRGAAAQNRRQAEWQARQESGLVTQEAQYRYWNANLPQGRVAHLHLLDVRTGRVTDLLEGTPYELPRDEPGLACFDVSPDGRRIVFRHDPAPVKAGGQRFELVQLTLRGRRFEPVAHHAQWDFTAPRFSPTGTHLAAIATPVGRDDTPYAHASFGKLAVWPTERAFRPGDALAWSQDPQGELHWERDGQALWVAAEQAGRCHAWRHALAEGTFTRAIEGGWVQALAVAGAGAGATVLSVRDGAGHPARAYLHHGGTERRLDRFNDALLRRVNLGRTEVHEVPGAQGDAVQLWVTYPPGFDRRRRHPVLQVIHGGPYTAAGDSFSWRWNVHALAAQGHVVVQPNFHGSSGFGEAFRTSILGRQGELELQDLQAATDWIVRQPWADAARVFAAGASYGGFLVAWMNAHWRPWPQGPIRAYVCHAGVFDRRATWSADSYSQRHRDLGATYWQAPERVAAQSPVTFAGRMDTPTFVIHGAQDFRVPDHNGLAYYNTLKARGVDARLLWFPDEGHWVLKPRNALQWYAQVADWLRRHDAPPGPARKATRRRPA